MFYQLDYNQIPYYWWVTMGKQLKVCDQLFLPFQKEKLNKRFKPHMIGRQG